MIWVSEAAASVCSDPGESVSVTVNLHQAAVEIDHTLSQQEIQKLSGTALVVNGRKSVVRGLTAVQAGYSSHATTKIRPAGDKFCGAMTDIRLEFGYPSRVVYIPEEYGEGSCEYRAILHHERKHLDANEDALNDFSPHFRLAVEKAVEEINPIIIETKDEARKRPLEILEAKLRPALKTFEQVRKQMHAGIDTQDEYRRVQNQCRNW